MTVLLLLRGLSLLTAAAIGFASLSCGGSETTRRYSLTGIVLESAGADGQVTIAHDAIDGLMPAMAMPLGVRGNGPALMPDDRITATLVVTNTESWIEDVVVTAKGPAGARTPAAEAVRSRLVGAAVPGFRLRDQDGRLLELASLKGRVVVVTFIYTRCPLPDYCPRMMSHVNAIKQALEPEPDVWRRVHLVAVSFDPAYDTPPVLRAYGERFISGPDRFTRVSLATGEPAEVQALAGFFGVKYLEEGGQISHSLSTGILGGDGRVAAIFPSNTWSPADAVEVIRHEVAVLR